jgi:hypothetical protein
VRALEPLGGLRVVADQRALDEAQWAGDGEVTVLRIAPDEAFAIGAEGVDVDDPDAIVEPEPGFSGASLDDAGLESVLAHVEFPLPRELPALVQGKVAGVAAKLLLSDDHPSLLVVQTAYAHDLETRLR